MNFLNQLLMLAASAFCPEEAAGALDAALSGAQFEEFAASRSVMMGEVDGVLVEL